MRLIALITLSYLWAQISSPNSFLALSVGAVAPTGSTQLKGRTYPSDGYALTGAGFGLHLNTFVHPYIALSLRVSQSFFSLDGRALGRDDHLFPEPVTIDENPRISHTLAGLGVGTGVQLDWVSLYVPVQLALGLYSAPEIEGRKSSVQTWVQPKFSTAQVGLSTGLIMNFPITDDFFAGVSLLFTSVSSGEKDFDRFRYTLDVQDRRFTYRSAVRSDMAEVGILLGLFF